MKHGSDAINLETFFGTFHEPFLLSSKFFRPENKVFINLMKHLYAWIYWFLLVQDISLNIAVSDSSGCSLRAYINSCRTDRYVIINYLKWKKVNFLRRRT